jgi:hypothetical protein
MSSRMAQDSEGLIASRYMGWIKAARSICGPNFIAGVHQVSPEAQKWSE